jgi:hypothetical protein
MGIARGQGSFLFSFGPTDIDPTDRHEADATQKATQRNEPQTHLGVPELRHHHGLVGDVKVDVRGRQPLPNLAGRRLPRVDQRGHVVVGVAQGAWMSCVCVVVGGKECGMSPCLCLCYHICICVRVCVCARVCEVPCRAVPCRRTGHGHLVYPEGAALGVRLLRQPDVGAPRPLVL